MKSKIVILSSLALVLGAVALSEGQQTGTPPPNAAPAAAAPAAGPPSAAHGQELFEANCSFCHNSDSTEVKVGPGFKGLSGRNFVTTNEKVTDQGIKDWILHGDNQMPPVGRSMTPGQIDDLVAYLNTL